MPSAVTHATIAASGYAVLALQLGFPLEDAVPAAALAALASIAPDLDRPGSAISRLVWPITMPVSWVLHRVFGHRGLVHSLTLAALVSYAGWVWLPLPFSLAVAWGWCSHVLIDAATPVGVPLGVGRVRLRLHPRVWGK